MEELMSPPCCVHHAACRLCTSFSRQLKELQNLQNPISPLPPLPINSGPRHRLLRSARVGRRRPDGSAMIVSPSTRRHFQETSPPWWWTEQLPGAQSKRLRSLLPRDWKTPHSAQVATLPPPSRRVVKGKRLLLCLIQRSCLRRGLLLHFRLQRCPYRWVMHDYGRKLHASCLDKKRH